MNKTIFFKTIFLATLGVFVLSYMAIDGSINWIHFGIHFFIIALSLLHIAGASSFNLGLSFSFFALFFFGVIPLLEYKLNITYHGANLPRDSSYLGASSLALLSSIFFYIGYGLKKAIRLNTNALIRVQYANRLHYQLICAVTAIGIITSTAYIAYHYEYDFNSIFFRGFGDEVESSVIGFSFVNFFARPLLFNLIFLIVLTRTKRMSTPDITVYIFCLLLVVFVSPLGIARSLAGALYIPLLLLVFFPGLVSKYSILLIIIFSVLVAAPIVDIFRLIHLGEVNLTQNFTVDYFFAGHFDAFHNLVQVIEWDYSSKGWQLIGALLFWIPRTLWPDKPIGTSFEFADFAGFRSGNISFPLTAELFVDFGILGVVLGMLFLGIVYKWLDNFFSKPRTPGSLSAHIFVIGHLELAILGIYLLRGNFLSTFAFTVSLASTFIVLRIVSGSLRNISLELAYKLRPLDKSNPL